MVRLGKKMAALFWFPPSARGTLVPMSNVTMNYQLLGRGGLRVSDLCLGTMTFGEDWGWGAGKDEARRIYEAYRGAGGNFIDTANVYTGGSSEKFVGEFIAGHRDEVVLATKYSNAVSAVTGVNGDPNAGGNQRKNMVRAVEASLKRLGTDYIDLCWLHVWDALTPAEEVMRAFDDLVRAGKVLYVGISDAPAWVVSKSNTLAALRGWTPYVGLQIEYSLLERTVEQELLPMARDFGLSILAWSPLRNGVLSGKYLPENANGVVNGRMNSPMMKGFGFRADDPTTDAVVRETVAVANELGVSAAQVALAWLRTRPAAVIPIVGARKLTQFEDNLRSLDIVLSSEQRERLDRVSAVPLGFPQKYYKNDSVQAMLYGGLRDRIKV
jgi:aryl-alcohol dehydrogenase-like predicted oxidoreductase